MRLVKKFKPNQPIIVVRDLEHDERLALISAFVEDDAEDQELEKARSILEFVRDHEAWIECDCLDSSRALLTVAISAKGRHYLRHLSARSRHENRCPFKETNWQYDPFNGGLSPFGKKRPLRVHRRAGLDDSKEAKKESVRSGGSARYPCLARILYTWITEAGLNYLPSSDEEKLSDRFKLLKQVASEYELEEGVNASQCFFTYPDVDQMVVRLKETEHLWPSDSRPYALCVSIADDVIGNLIRFSFKEKTIEVELEGIIKKSSGRLGENSGPFLVIFTVTDTLEERGIYRPFSSFVVPVFSKAHLIPVDSTYERRVLERLRNGARWWINDKGLKVKISKPLFDMRAFNLAGEEDFVKPDFVIETPKEKIIFEIMGSYEDEYLERKKRVIPVMKSIGEVIELDALGADQSGCWDERLKRAMSRLSALVFRGN